MTSRNTAKGTDHFSATSNFFKSLLTCALLIFSFDSGNAQELLNRNVELKTIESKTIEQVLGTLAFKYRIPVADELEPDLTRRETSCFDILPDQATVAMVLNAITLCGPNYGWEAIEGVIRVFSPGVQDPFLDIVIADLELSNKTTAEIKTAIIASPAVRSKLAELRQVARDLQLNSVRSREKAPTFSVSLRNASVRDVLFHLQQIGAIKYWSVIRWGPDHTYVWLNIW